MGKNKVIKEFSGDGTFIAPAGVTQVEILAYESELPSWGPGLGINPVNGLAYSWGRNTEGQVGDGTIVNKSSPVAVVGNNLFKRVISCGKNRHAIDFDGNCWSWGDNNQGELGNSAVGAKSSPVLVVGNLKFKQVSELHGYYDVVAGLTENGDCYTWGGNGNGALGTGSSSPSAVSSPVLVIGNLKFKRVAAGSSHVLGLTTAGDLYAWGRNTEGQLGNGDINHRSSPVAVVGGLKFKEISVSYGSSYGLTVDGILYSWGENTVGQLGDGTIAHKSSPVAVLGGKVFSRISASGYGGTLSFCLGIATDGATYAWGANTQGNLGDGTIAHKSSPVAVVGGQTFVDVKAMGAQGYGNNGSGITASGDIYCWGVGGQGSLGDGTSVSKSSPVAVIGGIKFVQNVASPAQRHVVAVTPSESYAVTLTGVIAKFGNVNLGKFIEKIKVSYDA